MSAGTNMLLEQNLRELKLNSILKRLPDVLRQSRDTGIGYEDFLLELTELEIRARMDTREKRRLSEAHFPLMKPIEAFDQDAVPNLDKRLLKDLLDGTYIKEKRNVILLGKSGTGKTHIATALGIEACRQSKRVRFITGYALVNELVEAREQKTVSRVVSKYSRVDVLILDELGYVPFSKEGAELLFQVLAERHERSSVIITSNLGFGDWTQIFGDHNMTAALLDRITHHAHIIECSWESFRLKQTLKGGKRSAGKL